MAVVEGHLAREDELTDTIRALDADQARIPERWAAEDARAASALQRTLLDTEIDRLLGVALAHAPELDAVHAEVARVARRRSERAEADGRPLDVARHTELVRRHDRGEHAAWLSGGGHLTLLTAPSGVPVVARRYEERGRRLILGEPVPLGITPLERVPLERGSYGLDVGGTFVPVHLGRTEHWDGIPPGGDATTPVPLLTPGPGEAYVPPGPYVAGGDPDARNPRPRRRVWVDGFFVRVHPVTHGEYLAFLCALVEQGRADEAARFAPHGGLTKGQPTFPLVDGRPTLPAPDYADLPVFLVDWPSATAYAAWEAERTGLPWRLPTLAEREKAARGVDGRLFPWGNTWHPEWSNTGLSFAQPRPAPIALFPLDVSPYGVRGLAGNVSDWLADGFTEVMARVDRAGPAAPGDDPYRTFAGGAWNSGVVYARATNFGRYRPDSVVTSLGFRLARSA